MKSTILQTRSLLEPLAVATVIAFLVISGVLTFEGFRRLRQHRLMVRHTNEVLLALEQTELALIDAETGQRGFVIAGREEYLEPLTAGMSRIEGAVGQLAKLINTDPLHTAQIRELRKLVAEKVAKLRITIRARIDGEIEPAQAAVNKEVGKNVMARIRQVIGQMRDVESRLIVEREAVAEATYRYGLLTTVSTTLVALTLFGAVLYLISNNRRRAVKASRIIQAEKERLRVTLFSIGDAVIATDELGRISSMNPVAESLTGWTSEQASGLALTQVFHIIDEATLKPVANPAMRALAEGVVVGLTNHTILIGKDGSETPIDDSAAPIRDDEGKLVGCVLIFRDISQRHQIEKQLRASQDQIRMTLDSAGMGTWHIDPKTNTLTGDNQLHKLFGREGQSLTYEEAFTCVHIEDRERVRQSIEASTRPVAPEPYAIEYRVVHGDGSVYWLRAQGRANSDGAQLTSFDGTIVDITDRKRIDELEREADSQFRLLADNIPQLAWTAKPGSEGLVDWINQSWFDYTGTTLEEMQGTGWQKVHHPDHAQRVIEKFKHHVRECTDWEDTFPLRGKDGEYRWFLSRMKVIRNRTGKGMRIFGTNTDVNEQFKLADSLRSTAAQLSEADRCKDEFLATLAHELRNPLAPIKNAVELMGMTKLDDDLDELRQIMARQVEQMVRLIDDLLDVSRISRGKIVLQREVVDLAPIVNAAVEASSTFIAESGQTLNVAFLREGVFVNVDPARITQIISNLLNNSSKYSDAGSNIDLNVAVEKQQAVIQIRDNGIGIAADRLQDIFQMFSQVSESLERGSAGLGIGLTLVKTLVEAHGGSVVAQSEGLGHGSVFTVTLPIADEVARVHRPKPMQAVNERRFKILVVEDQRALRFVLTRLLETMGHEVVSVDSGMNAMEKLVGYVPDLVFSDISMPGMTGYELVKQLRNRAELRDVHFVAMTGFGQETDRDQAIQSGFDEHMVKPVDVERLYDLFGRLST